jgi:high-affinity iron transporter
LIEAQFSPGMLAEGKRLYAQNCAACHGEAGGGDGVFAGELAAAGEAGLMEGMGHLTTSPVDFTDAGAMLGASPALLQGKILRGGMGTGMPYWGPIFTEDQTWALVAYLQSFSISMENQP